MSLIVFHICICSISKLLNKKKYVFFKIAKTIFFLKHMCAAQLGRGLVYFLVSTVSKGLKACLFLKCSRHFLAILLKMLFLFGVFKEVQSVQFAPHAHLDPLHVQTSCRANSRV